MASDVPTQSGLVTDDRQDPSTGRFVAGNRGGPGRHKGVKEFRTILRERLDHEAFAQQLIYHATVEKLPWAIALLVERLWPKRLELETEEVRSYEGPYLAPFTSSDEAECARLEGASDAEVVEMIEESSQ